ncbi:hypothetical protein K4L44_01240 [Halosquirtibacter laminarini]|uniref:Uncharacterized protein n=1 Tax=Halosquirtibacter laminarini TaxID=3374600 RepID=A0AC61NP40_9BACT|nr:hypothetical protein K4L44_01240 [Prolixibacteraceae bacterium]
MFVLKVVLISIVLVAICVAGLATQILLKKNGQFPHTHVGGNREMKKRGLICAKSYDALEQKRAYSKVNFKSLKIAK